MRVLLIDVNCKSSSTGQIVYNLYSYLNSHGDEAAVCYGRGQKINERNIFKFGLDWETYLHAFLTRITGYTGCFSFFSTKRLIKFIEEFKPDVVHIHELHAYFVNIKQLLEYLSKKNIKVVHTLHCEFSYTGKCGHSIECEKWKSECGNCPHLRNYPSTLFFDHTNRMYKDKKVGFEKIKDLTIVTPSQWLADRTKQSFFKRRKITIIHNGVDTDIFHPVDASDLRANLDISSEDLVVLSLAPDLMSKEKGGNFVLEIARKVNKSHIKFVMVGVDDIANIKADGVIVKGRIYDKQILAQYYSLADVFLICSERENFPTTCLEAQACGTPIIGFATGGVGETIIETDYNLVEYGDVTTLVEVLERQKKLTNNKRNMLSSKAAAKFGIKKMMYSYLSIYN